MDPFDKEVLQRGAEEWPVTPSHRIPLPGASHVAVHFQVLALDPGCFEVYAFIRYASRLNITGPDGHLYCLPGNCSAYSSVSYELAGSRHPGWQYPAITLRTVRASPGCPAGPQWLMGPLRSSECLPECELPLPFATLREQPEPPQGLSLIHI